MARDQPDLIADAGPSEPAALPPLICGRLSLLPGPAVSNLLSGAAAVKKPVPML